MRTPCAGTPPPFTLPCPAPAEDQHGQISTHKTNLFITILVLKNLAGFPQPPSAQQVPSSRAVTGAGLTQPLHQDRDGDLVSKMALGQGPRAPTLPAAPVLGHPALGCPSPSHLNAALLSGHPWHGSCRGGPLVSTILIGVCTKAPSPAAVTPNGCCLPNPVRLGLRLQQKTTRLEVITWCKDAINIFRACFCP